MTREKDLDGVFYAADTAWCCYEASGGVPDKVAMALLGKHLGRLTEDQVTAILCAGELQPVTTEMEKLEKAAELLSPLNQAEQIADLLDMIARLIERVDVLEAQVAELRKR